ncbi:hypothetical protein COU18_00375 [Candidatus Kaiserbacteria bacterium CG10_big_fil_rev_8_21_14_0_10_51_14]|uniref:Uncharacterized protein n=1 Tax=Candidatus Kaiserbacteria bacterium CG10_big_fil_rev_8_21_14_0_10_51_14 TaxID=1974610 RepID=A0A2H0UEU2_9BACT|nr:MAG: hypothetical protein COU18_00375 [Candidatus Kaiserbacteria bacterium CG10_big_fil_rev_8_21_14_0_10_51_14]
MQLIEGGLKVGQTVLLFLQRVEEAHEEGREELGGREERSEEQEKLKGFERGGEGALMRAL